MFSLSKFFSRGTPLVLALALALPLGARAAEQQHSLSEKTSEMLQKVRPLIDAKNYAGVSALIEELIPSLNPTSYDMAFLLDMKAKMFATQDQYGKAIQPWEQALRLAEAHGYFEPNWITDTNYFLAQLNYQEALNNKNPQVQQQFIGKALKHLERYLQLAKKPNADAPMLYASMLYNQAVADPNNINYDLINKAEAEVDKAFLNSIHPKEGLYALLLVILQQENNFARGAEVLELLVSKYPQKKDYWPTLMAFYVNLAGEKDKAGDSKAARELYVRAINTVERAQSLGHMKTPKDNYNLVTLYITAGQFSRANELLYTGLKNGTIESEPKTWLVLGYYYQQANQPLQAINVLKEAAQLYPTEGQLELQIGEIYRGLEKTADAYKHYQAAVKKGKLDKPYIAYQLVAYAAYELERFDEALEAVKQAEKFPDAQESMQLPELRKAIETAIAEREKKKADAAEKNKKAM